MCRRRGGERQKKREKERERERERNGKGENAMFFLFSNCLRLFLHLFLCCEL